MFLVVIYVGEIPRDGENYLLRFALSVYVCVCVCDPLKMLKNTKNQTNKSIHNPQQAMFATNE